MITDIIDSVRWSGTTKHVSERVDKSYYRYQTEQIITTSKIQFANENTMCI